LGFSLKEIKELLAIRVDARTTCAEVKRHAERKIADIEARIQSLRHMKAALSEITKQCAGRGPTSECPILEALDERCCP
jgi:MerR family mercuric resistance operon transcriptional regulator